MRYISMAGEILAAAVWPPPARTGTGGKGPTCRLELRTLDREIIKHLPPL